MHLLLFCFFSRALHNFFVVVFWEYFESACYLRCFIIIKPGMADFSAGANSGVLTFAFPKAVLIQVMRSPAEWMLHQRVISIIPQVSTTAVLRPAADKTQNYKPHSACVTPDFPRNTF